MSINIATEVRRISDARSRLKSIIDAIAQSQAAQLSPDDLKYQTNTTLAQSKKTVSDDIAVQKQGAIAVSSLTAPLSPIEPDFDTLKIWLPFTNLGKQPDLALLGNTGTTFGAAVIVDGPPSNDNGLFAGRSLRALWFDGYTCYCDVKDAAGIRLADCPTGFTFCCRIKINSIRPQEDNWWRRMIACKADDANNMWELMLTHDTGELVFHVKKAGVWYKVKVSGGAMPLDTWYDIVCTYTVSGNVCTIYRNNVASTTADTTPAQVGGITGDYDLHISRADNVILVGNELGMGAAFDRFSFDAQSFDTGDYLNSNATPYSINFTASSVQYAQMPYNSVFDNFAAFTFSCWIYPTGAYGTFLSKGWVGPGGLLFQVNAAGGLGWNILSNSSVGYGTGGTTINNQWNHIICVYDGANLTSYVNGSRSAGPSAAPAGTLTNAGALVLGNFTGSLADVRIYNVALTSTEISSLYKGKDVARGLAVRLPFTEGTGSFTVDSIHGLGCTLYNSPTWSTDLPTGSVLIPPVPLIPHSMIDGGFWGAMTDIRFYNFPLTSAQVGYLYANKFSISNIAYGAVASSGYCISHS